MKQIRSKKSKYSEGIQTSRQEMLGADWSTGLEWPTTDLTGRQPKRDIDHRRTDQDDRRSDLEVRERGYIGDSVALRRRDPPALLSSVYREEVRDQAFEGSTEQEHLTGAIDEQGEHFKSDHHVPNQIHSPGIRSGPQAADVAAPLVHAQVLHPSLIEEITERLRVEGGLSPTSIADLLARNNITHSGRILDNGVPSKQPIEPSSNRLASSTVYRSPDRRAKVPHVEVEVASFRKGIMSPGILIPRNAGIKVRGVEDDPPLVDAPAPDKSKIVVASQYLFQHDLEAAGMMNERDVQGRLQGIQVIEAGRRGLRMPMKTYGTACVFFMRYRYHIATKGTDDEIANRYDFRDAALASLWLASKAEETPKKSKEILCAFRNSTLPPEEHLTPDDEMFENQAKLMINLERYLLEIVAFDFRARNCAELLAGLMVDQGASEKVVKIAMAVVLDIYRTLAVLKQTRQTLALSCFEMAARFVQLEDDVSKATNEELYRRLGTTRQEVLETLFDLIELYLNHHVITAAGSKYNINDFMRVSTTLRSEMKAKGFSRYTYMQDLPPSSSPTTSPVHTDAKSTPTLLGTPRTPANRDADRRDSLKKRPSPKENSKILVDERDIEIGKPVSPPPSFLLTRDSNGYGTQSPTSPTSPTTVEATNPDDPSQVKEVVRFVLDASRARDEDLLRRPFYQIENVEVTEQKDIWIPKDGSAMQTDVGLSTTSPASPPLAGKMRNGDVDMRDAPASSNPSVPRGLRDVPPMGPRGDRDRDRDRDDRRDRDRDRDRERRRTPPPPSRMYGRDDRYGRRDERRW